jgi:cold-inducible RNA-binding protein
MNIYVGNLSLETTENDLREEFKKFGEVISITIMNDRYIGSGQPKGYGYINMVSKEEGANAIANIEGKMIKNRRISVVQALPLTRDTVKDPSAARKRSFKKRERNTLQLPLI